MRQGYHGYCCVLTGLVEEQHSLQLGVFHLVASSFVKHFIRKYKDRLLVDPLVRILLEN